MRWQKTALTDFVLPLKIKILKTKTVCAVCGVGFLEVFADGRKNKINSHQVCTNLTTEHQSNYFIPFTVSISICASRFDFILALLLMKNGMFS